MAAMNTPAPAAVNLRRLVLLRTIALGGQALAVWVAVVPLRMPVPATTAGGDPRRVGAGQRAHRPASGARLAGAR